MNACHSSYHQDEQGPSALQSMLASVLIYNE